MEEEILKNFLQLSNVLNIPLDHESFYDSTTKIITSLLNISKFEKETLMELLFKKYEKNGENEIEFLILIHHILDEKHEKMFKDICFSYLKKTENSERKGEISPKQRIACYLLSKLKIENFDFFFDFMKEDIDNQEYSLHSIIYLCSLYSNQIEMDENFYDLILTQFKQWDTSDRKICASSLLWCFFKNEKLKKQRVEKFWNLIFESFGSDDKELRNESYGLLSQFYDLFFHSTLIDLRFNENFWTMIQTGLLGTVPYTAKRCIFLIKKVIETTKNDENSNNFFHWNDKYSNELENLWEIFFTIYENLEQLAIHLILSSWKDILNLFPKRKEDLHKYLSFIWPAILLEKSFAHNNFQIKTLALQTLFELDFSIYSNSFPNSFLCDSLIKPLNEPRLYEENKTANISENLIQFYLNYIHSFEKLQDKQQFLNDLLDRLGSYTHHSSISCFTKMLELLDIHDLFDIKSLDLLYRVVDNNCRSKTLWIELKNESQIIHSLLHCCQPSSKNIQGIIKLLESFEMNVMKENIVDLISEWLLKEKIVIKEFLKKELLNIHSLDFDSSIILGKRIARLFKFLPEKSFENLLIDHINMLPDFEKTPFQKNILHIYFLKNLFLELHNRDWFSNVISNCSTKFNSIFDYISTIIEFPTTFSCFDEIKKEKLEPLTIEYFVEYIELISFFLRCQVQNLSAEKFLGLLKSSIDFISNVEKSRNNDILKKRSFYVAIYLINSIEVIVQFAKLKINNILIWSEKDENLLLELVEKLLNFDPKIQDGDYSPPTDFYLSNENLSTLFSNFHTKKWEILNIFIHLLSRIDTISFSKIKNLNEFITNEVDCLNGANSTFVIDTISILANTQDFENLEYVLNTIFESVIHFDSKYSLGAFISFSTFILNLNFWKRNISNIKILKNLLKKVLNYGKMHPRFLAILSPPIQHLILSENDLKNELVKEIIDFLVITCEINEDDFLYTTDSILSTCLYDKQKSNSYAGIYFSHKYLQGTIFSAIANLNSFSDSEFINLLIVELLNFSRKKFPKSIAELPGSYAHRHLIRVWRLLNILVEYITEEMALKFDELIWQCFDQIILNSIRRLIEIFYSNLTLKYPILIDSILKKLVDYNGRPQLVGTLLLISGNVVVFHESNDLFIENFYKLFPYISNMLTSPQNTIRCMAQLTYEKIYESFKKRKLIEKIDEKYIKHLEVSFEYMHKNKSVLKWIEKYRTIFEQNPLVDSLPENLIGRPIVDGEFIINDTLTEVDFKKISNFKYILYSLVSMKNEFSNEFRIERVLKNWKTFDYRNLKVIQEEYLKKMKLKEDEKIIDSLISASSNSMSVVQNYQRKIKPYSMEDLETELNPRLKYLNKKKQSLIVVASFIDRLPNLAGLTRTSEIFSIEKLILNSKNVIKHDDFLTISVSSEKWVPIEEVKPEGLEEFFKEQKKLGYSIVGVEQTQNSVSIEEFQFPEKSVLVLGKEKEGIPVEFIQMLDFCVEIPQLVHL
eukprot:gene10480-3002_t